MAHTIPNEITRAASAMLAPYCPGITPDKLETAVHFKDVPTETLRTRIKAKGLLGVSMPTIDRMIKAGELRAVRVRGRVMIPQSALDAIMKGEVVA